MVGVPGKYKGCNTCRARRVKVCPDLVAWMDAVKLLIVLFSSAIMNGRDAESVQTLGENAKAMVSFLMPHCLQSPFSARMSRRCVLASISIGAG